MANSRRTAPPRPGPWETPVFRRDQQDTWLFREWPINIKNKISSTLKEALIKPNVVRLLRSDLSEWSEDDVWHCYRLLGAGSFGTAAVWQRKDADDKLLDEVVVKEDRKKGHSKYPKAANLHGIFLEEAEIMQTLNTHSGSGNIVHLRGYKVFLRNPRVNQRKRKRTDPIVHNEIHRFYLEYAPYGTLTNLALRYKAFNRYLPELFLWHVFNSLAKAAVELGNLPDTEECYVHLDLKPDNIFLGYENAKPQNPEATGGLDGEAVGYPSVKLGDFGVAEKVSRGENDGLKETAGVGTACYKAPEIIRATGDAIEGPGQYGGDWDPPLNPPTDTLTSMADIWAIGKVMYDLFSLSRPMLFNNLQAKSREDYAANGDKMISDFCNEPFLCDELHDKSPYTKDLSDVIEWCMHGESARRPTPTMLEAITRRLLTQRYADTPSTLPCSVRNRKLYYCGNEINDMSIAERNCGQSLTVLDWDDLMAPGNNDPNEPKLDIYPAQIWEMRQSQELRDLAFKAYRTYTERTRETELFRELLLENERRINLGQAEIEFLDPDAELTYQGKKDAAHFIEEGKKRRRDLDGSSGGGGGGGDDGDDGDDGDGDGDGDGGGERSSSHGDDNDNNVSGQDSRGRSKAPRYTESARRPSKKTPKLPRKHHQGTPEYVMDGGIASTQQVSRFTPYIPIEAHQERFENTSDGQDLIFVIDTAPDSSLIPSDLPAMSSIKARKRAADFFETPLLGQDMQSELGETASELRKDLASGEKATERRKRRRLSERPRISKDSSAQQQPR